jgi:hypothetical protein
VRLAGCLFRPSTSSRGMSCDSFRQTKQPIKLGENSSRSIAAQTAEGACDTDVQKCVLWPCLIRVNLSLYSHIPFQNKSYKQN